MPFPTSTFAQSGQFSNVRELGRGAFGKVYYAVDHLGREVAVKEVLPSHVHFQKARAQFDKEARILASLKHQNIIAVYWLLEEPQTKELYLVCEYANGGSLRDYLETQGRLNERQAIKVTLDICAALEVTSSKRIVHRDIKPSNILLEVSGIGEIVGAKLGDFGVALDPQERRTTDRQGSGHPGTLEYAAPEQGNSTNVLDVSADLYALGITLWEMLTTVSQDDIGYKFLQLQTGTSPDLRQYNPATSPGIAQIIQHAVQDDRGQRYRSPQQMTDDLRKVRDGIWPLGPTTRIGSLPTQRLDPSPLPPTRKSPMRWIAPLVLVALLALGGAFGLPLVMRSSDNSTPMPDTHSLAPVSDLPTAGGSSITSEPTYTDTPEPTATVAPSPSPTVTPIPPTPTSTSMPSPTETPAPSATTKPLESPTVPSVPTVTPGDSSRTGLTNESLIGSGVKIDQQAGGTGLRVIMLGPDNQPWKGAYVEVYEQKPDVSGNPTRGNGVGSGRIDQRGQLDFELGGGAYGICTGVAAGYTWTNHDCIYDVQVKPGSLTVAQLQAGQLEVAIVGADGVAWNNVYYEIYTQKQDVNGNPVKDRGVASGRTDNTGLGSSWLTPGLYIMTIDLGGYNWGRLREGKGQINLVVEKGKINRQTIRMGRLSVGLKQLNGDPATNVYLEIYMQKAATNGQPVLADGIWSGRTDNGGFATIDLTAGNYALKIGDNILWNVRIDWGRVTTSDGTTFAQQ